MGVNKIITISLETRIVRIKLKSNLKYRMLSTMSLVTLRWESHDDISIKARLDFDSHLLTLLDSSLSVREQDSTAELKCLK